MQDRAFVNAFCTGLPGAVVTQPFGPGHDAWKVGGKMFAIIGSVGDGVSLKTPDIETAALLIEVGRAIRAPYLHRSWVRIGWGSVPDDELCERLVTSYGLIRAALPRKVQAGLAPVGGLA